MSHPGLVYDAADVSTMLGLAGECSQPTPEASGGEVVVWYGGWSLKQLREAIGLARMWSPDCWYDRHAWTAEQGYYRLLLPVVDSNWQRWADQKLQLMSIAPDFAPAPVCVAATALLCHLWKAKENLLTHSICRCAESLPNERHVTLSVFMDRVSIDQEWDLGRYDDLWLAASRKL